jgi:tRNA U34 5-methylaminomethyl-2-thiouridine-forming methyltransferase MnmC
MGSQYLKNKLIITGDGSSSVFSEKFNCTYHSVHGAIRESDHIFIQSGLCYFLEKTKRKHLKILEFGFGTGLNALLSISYSETNSIKIDYNTIEAYPISAELVSDLNYTQIDGLSKLKEEFLSMHNTQNEILRIGNYFSFSKSISTFEDYKTCEKFDVIFFDAFGPDEQPHLWNRPFLDKIPEFLNPDAIIVTYCVKGSFKRALKEIGFKIEKLPGPQGKREILRAEMLK